MKNGRHRVPEGREDVRERVEVVKLITTVTGEANLKVSSCERIRPVT